MELNSHLIIPFQSQVRTTTSFANNTPPGGVGGALKDNLDHSGAEIDADRE